MASCLCVGQIVGCTIVPESLNIMVLFRIKPFFRLYQNCTKIVPLYQDCTRMLWLARAATGWMPLLAFRAKEQASAGCA